MARSTALALLLATFAQGTRSRHTPAAFAWGGRLPKLAALRPHPYHQRAAGMAMSAEATAPEGASVGERKVARGSQREFVNTRVMLSWDACLKKERPRIVAAASLIEFQRASSLVLPPGQEWVHLDRPDGLKASGRQPKDSRVQSTASVDALERGAYAVSLDLTNVGNDLLMDTLAVVTRLASVHLDTLEVLLVKSRAVSELAMKLLPAKRALERGVALFDDRTFRPAVICSTGVLEYRSMIPIVVRPGDSVLEIGCHGGTTTRLLQEAAGPGGRAVGVDIGVSIVRQAAAAHPGVEFEVADAWDSHALVTLARDHPWDAIFIDVGGLSGGDGVLEAVALIRQLAASNPKCRSMVIKSLCMSDLSRTLFASNELLHPLQRRVDKVGFHD